MADTIINSDVNAKSSRKRLNSQDDADQLKKLKLKRSKPWTNDNDIGLPKELKMKFTPLKCNLCDAVMNSTLQAKMHYSGNVHEKKVSQFLLEWSQKTGNPIPEKEKEEEEIDKDYLFCSKCNLQFTSKMNAQQHYMGKNHKRSIPKIKSTPSDPSGRFFIGQNFKIATNTDPLNLNEDLNNIESDPLTSLNCTLCQIICSSRDQMLAHLNGSKHKKRSTRSEILKHVKTDNSEDKNE